MTPKTDDRMAHVAGIVSSLVELYADVKCKIECNVFLELLAHAANMRNKTGSYSAYF
jgi:hypothetical protein